MTAEAITVTIKYGKGYEETWAVFKGESCGLIRRDIREYFGIEEQAVEGMTLHELVTNVTSLAHGSGNAAAILGAVALPKGQGAQPAESPAGGNPWAGLDEGTPASPEKAEHPFQHVLDALAGCQSTADVQKVWAANQAAFKDDTVIAAYKARGKELSK